MAFWPFSQVIPGEFLPFFAPLSPTLLSLYLCSSLHFYVSAFRAQKGCKVQLFFSRHLQALPHLRLTEARYEISTKVFPAPLQAGLSTNFSGNRSFPARAKVGNFPGGGGPLAFVSHRKGPLNMIKKNLTSGGRKKGPNGFKDRFPSASPEPTYGLA